MWDKFYVCYRYFMVIFVIGGFYIVNCVIFFLLICSFFFICVINLICIIVFINKVCLGYRNDIKKLKMFDLYLESFL